MRTARPQPIDHTLLVERDPADPGGRCHRDHEAWPDGDALAVIIEPVQGEGGFHGASPEVLQGLRRIADDNGIVLIADEEQRGVALTGTMFGIEHSGIRPDLITVAKALGGGFPLSGVIGRAEVMDAVDPGGLGGTYAGSPIACAAALAVLDVIEEQNLCARSRALGERVVAQLQAFAARSDLRPIGHVRALGSMIARVPCKP